MHWLLWLVVCLHWFIVRLCLWITLLCLVLYGYVVSFSGGCCRFLVWVSGCLLLDWWFWGVGNCVTIGLCDCALLVWWCGMMCLIGCTFGS